MDSSDLNRGWSVSNPFMKTRQDWRVIRLRLINALNIEMDIVKLYDIE